MPEACAIWRKTSAVDYEKSEPFPHEFAIADALRRRLALGMAIDDLAVETESGRFVTASRFLKEFSDD